MDGEELDVEDNGVQSDEEGFAVGEDEETAQRELQVRPKFLIAVSHRGFPGTKIRLLE